MANIYMIINIFFSIKIHPYQSLAVTEHNNELHKKP